MEELLEKLLRALEAAGIRAQAALPAKLIPRLREPLTAVGLTRARAVEQGLGRYLGEQDSLLSGRRAIYGRTVEATVFFRIASPVALGGRRCFQEANRLMDTLLAGIDGVDVGQFTQEQCRYDPVTDQFVCTISAEIRARMFLQAPDDPEPTVADVIVRYAGEDAGGNAEN